MKYTLLKIMYNQTFLINCWLLIHTMQSDELAHLSKIYSNFAGDRCMHSYIQLHIHKFGQACLTYETIKNETKKIDINAAEFQLLGHIPLCFSHCSNV